ncbi:MAG: hypothetical protein R3284_05285 [Rubricoccaceae bacterium]|nr:hypothetical protein [Rubricoccaceae bacterium]
MRPLKRICCGLLYVVGVAIGLAGIASTQAQPGTWNAYPSLREALSVTAAGNVLWCATSGGVFSFDSATGEIRRFTTVDGLFGVGAQAIVYDGRRNAVWVGYGEGVIDRIDVETGEIQAFFDIARADQFTDKTIRRIRVRGDELYVATAFGMVVFDAVRNEVRNTYSRLGPLEPAIPVTDVLFSPLPEGSDGIWMGTPEGVVYAQANNPNLQQPSAWTLDPNSPPEVTSLAFFQNRVNAATSADTYRRLQDGSWAQVYFTQDPISSLEVVGQTMFGISDLRLFRLQDGVGISRVVIEGYSELRDLTETSNGDLWLADGLSGLSNLPVLPEGTGDFTVQVDQAVVPAGPFMNEIAGLATGSDGSLWMSHERVAGRVGISSLLDDEWVIFSNQNGALPPAQAQYESMTITSDGSVYAGSQGDGLTRIQPSGAVTTYDDSNSTLENVVGSDPDFIVVGDVVEDQNGNIWVTNRSASTPIHVLSPDGNWTGIPYPPGIPSSITFDRIIVDSFDQKWMTAELATASGGEGLVAYSSGTDPFSSADDQGLHLRDVGIAGTGLPNEQVNALAFDLEERLWIGTARGLATIFTPGAAFGGNPALVTPQWARTEDGASFFLRDLNINDIAVDPANQKWLASTTGAWLISAEGDEVLLNFTTENSPLFSNNVLAVSVDESTGRIYFATDSGLLSYDGEATAAVEEVQDLDVAPSPYRPDVHSRGVLISGLVAETEVRILTIDGQNIATIQGQGGSVRWDGRDERTGELVGSGVYLVAAVAANGEGTAHGKIAVIR